MLAKARGAVSLPKGIRSVSAYLPPQSSKMSYGSGCGGAMKNIIDTGPLVYRFEFELPCFAFPNRFRCRGRNTPNEASSCQSRSGRRGKQVHYVKEQQSRPA